MWRVPQPASPGTAVLGAGRCTAVLEKRGKDWLLLHEHMSVRLGGEEKK